MSSRAPSFRKHPDHQMIKRHFTAFHLIALRTGASRTRRERTPHQSGHPNNCYAFWAEYALAKFL